MARRSCTKLRLARIAPPAPGGPQFEGLIRRKEMTMTTTMTELREVDRDELACVDGGVRVDPGFIPPSPLPPGSPVYQPGPVPCM
jgi:hypothetical protein